MPLNDTYDSIESPSEGVFRDKGSRFIAKAFPVESESDVKIIMDSLKREYHDARHHCFAYRIGLDGSTWRANDDGEPSGSAGRQILGQIDSSALSDVLVVVIRYFGGIKLGIPGLIRAYRTATSEALSSASRIGKVAGTWMALEFPYGQMQQVMSLVKQMDLPQRSQSFGELCSMEVRVRLSVEKDFLERIKKIGNFIK